MFQKVFNEEKIAMLIFAYISDNLQTKYERSRFKKRTAHYSAQRTYLPGGTKKPGIRITICLESFKAIHQRF